jgi:hypothetical protein
VRIAKREFSNIKSQKKVFWERLGASALFQGESWKNQCWKDTTIIWVIPHPILDSYTASCQGV